MLNKSALIMSEVQGDKQDSFPAAESGGEANGHREREREREVLDAGQKAS